MTINKIKIHNIATYRDPVDFEPRKINFIFGSNGCGKTTISNLLGDYIKSEDCQVDKDADSVLVYNKKFVESNFSSQVKGIFSLGEDSVSVQSQVQELNTQIEEKKQEISKKERKIREYQSVITENREYLKEGCWKIQQKLGPVFPESLTGVRNSKEAFLSKLLEESQKGTEYTVNYEELQESYTPTFSSERKAYELFSLIDINIVNAYQSNRILQKKIMGSSDTPTGKFIEYLQNSDWVRTGMSFLAESDSNCPFCQQKLPSNFEDELNQYFDLAFEKEIIELEDFISEYTIFFDGVLNRLQLIISTEIPFLDVSCLVETVAQLESTIKLNYEKLNNKKKYPSYSIELISVTDVCEDVNILITEINNKILKNNQVTENQKDEQIIFKQKLWIHIVNQSESLVSHFFKLKMNTEKGIEGIGKSVNACRIEEQQMTAKVSELESSLTSITPTIRAINSILEKFGFKGFKLGENQTQKGTYKIVREDGSDAKETLSEGEYNFITFLYYYYLVYGSHETTGTGHNKAVVIDDPISSLDSNVIFIVSSLVKKLINDCREKQNGITQVIILTHNMYFYKEASFLGSRKDYKADEVLYGILKKENGATFFKKYECNPIQTTYEMLWQDVKDDRCSSATCFNSMRRILEHYFQLLGGKNYEQCIDDFDGEDKLVCNALISAINDGSHFINDDFVIQFDSESIQKYKNVFRKVFENLGQLDHYEMMMSR